MTMNPGELAAQIVKAAVSAVAGPLAGGVTEALLRELLAVQDRQVELILELRADVSLLRNGPWATARMHLQQAAAPGRTAAEIAEYLTLARNSLFEAIPLQYEQTLDRSQVCLDLAMVLRILGDVPGSRTYARQAWAELVGVAQKECDAFRQMINPTEAEARTQPSKIPKVLMTRVKHGGASFWAKGWYFLERKEPWKLIPTAEHRMLERGQIPQGSFSTYPETKAIARMWAITGHIEDLRRVCERFGVPKDEVPYEELRVRLNWRPPEVSLRARRTPPGTVPPLDDVLQHRDRLLSAASSRGAKSVVLVGAVIGGTCWIDDLLNFIGPSMSQNPVAVGFLVYFASDQVTAEVVRSLECDFEGILETRVYVVATYPVLASQVQPQLSL
jgi:hypothetical protein